MVKRTELPVPMTEKRRDRGLKEGDEGNWMKMGMACVMVNGRIVMNERRGDEQAPKLR